MSARRARCPEGRAWVRVFRDRGVWLFEAHGGPVVEPGGMCSGSGWLVEQEDYETTKEQA